MLELNCHCECGRLTRNTIFSLSSLGVLDVESYCSRPWSCYYIFLEPAHPLSPKHVFLFFFNLQLDEHITKENIKDFPLVGCAGLYWADHTEVGNISSHTEDMIKRLPETPSYPDLAPLHDATRHRFHRVAEWLITTSLGCTRVG